MLIQGLVTATPACQSSVLEDDCKSVVLRSASAVSCLNLSFEHKIEQDFPYTQGVSQIHDDFDISWSDGVDVCWYSL